MADDLPLDALDALAGGASPSPSLSLSLSSSPAPGSSRGELSLQETEELLHTLDATAFFQDEEAPVAAVASPPPAKKAARSRAGGPAAAGKPARSKSAPMTANGKMRNPSRERLQAELAYLRKKVVELQDELTTLHETSGNAQAQAADGNARALVPVWQRIAERQLQGRRRAEAENLRLKGTLEGQIRLARHLEQVLRKRPNVGVLSDDGLPFDPVVMSHSPYKKRLRIGGEQGEIRPSVYELLLAEVDEAYTRTDMIFQQNGLESSIDDSVRHAYVKTRRTPDGRDVLYAELMDINIIPFELDRVGTAAWRSVKRQYYAKTPYDSYHRAPDDDNTIALKYRMQCERKGVPVALDAVLVMRRFVERDRVAIVWRCVSQAARDQTALSGMYTDETGWSIFKPVSPSAELSLAGAGTVMQSCVHVVPKRASGVVVTDEEGGLDLANRHGRTMRVSEMQHEIGLLTNAVIDAYEDVVVSMNSTMEDILLEETLATPDPVALKVWSW